MLSVLKIGQAHLCQIKPWWNILLKANAKWLAWRIERFPLVLRIYTAFKSMLLTNFYHCNASVCLASI